MKWGAAAGGGILFAAWMLDDKPLFRVSDVC